MISSASSLMLNCRSWTRSTRFATTRRPCSTPASSTPSNVSTPCATRSSFWGPARRPLRQRLLVVEGGDHFGDGRQLGLQPVDLALDAVGLGLIVLDLRPLLPFDGIDELELEPADGVPYEILVEGVHDWGVPLERDADTSLAAAVP